MIISGSRMSRKKEIRLGKLKFNTHTDAYDIMSKAFMVLRKTSEFSEINLVFCKKHQVNMLTLLTLFSGQCFELQSDCLFACEQGKKTEVKSCC